MLPTASGIYTFQVTYNGATCSKNFEIINPLAVSFNTNLSPVQVAPNPTSGIFDIIAKDIETGIYTYNLSIVWGQIISTEKMTEDSSTTIQKSFSISRLENGIYFLPIENENTRTVVKIVKQ